MSTYILKPINDSINHPRWLEWSPIKVNALNELEARKTATLQASFISHLRPGERIPTMQIVIHHGKNELLTTCVEEADDSLNNPSPRKRE